jgi:hypothetical protein
MHRLPFDARLIPLALLLAVIGSGCSTSYYEIVLIPDGDAVERQLTCWKQRNEAAALEAFPADRLKQIASAYSAVPAAKLDQKHSFSARFVGKMPADVGGSGTLTHWTCPFGSATAYLERFGGNDDVAQQIKDRQEASNRLINLCIGWLERELGGESHWDDLRRFLDTQVRHDLENISYTLLVAGGAAETLETEPADPNRIAESPVSFTTIGIRLWQLLVERKYAEPGDLPLVFSGDGSLLFPYFERTVARQLGLADDAPRPAAMAFLASSDAAKASLDRYLRTTPEYLKLERAWQERKKNNPDEPPPETAEVWQELFQAAFFRISFKDSTKLKVILLCGERPAVTNGIWDVKKRQVYWKTSKNGDQGLPTFVYAMWSVPIADAQIKQFGKVVLSGENLYEYVMWYRGISRNQIAEWNAFLATLHPDRNLEESLKQFRFSDDPPSPADPNEPVPSSRADEPRRLIISGLSSMDES